MIREEMEAEELEKMDDKEAPEEEVVEDEEEANDLEMDYVEEFALNSGENEQPDDESSEKIRKDSESDTESIEEAAN